MSFPKGVRGIGKGIGVGFFKRPAISRFFPSLMVQGVSVGSRIGHTRLPMKEHLGQPQIITVLRGCPWNYSHIKAIVRPQS